MIHKFEIIAGKLCIMLEQPEIVDGKFIAGYPVQDGSAEWALYQMMQGAYIIHESSAKNECVRLHGELVYSDYHGSAFCKKNDFLNVACKDGWQLYEPQPQFQVGDWVELSRYSKHQGQIKKMYEKGNDELYGVRIHRSYPTFTITGLSGEFHYDIIRKKLQPSEVVVPVSLSGMVSVSIDPSAFILRPIYGKMRVPSIISFEMLDPATRSLVEKLLKAQEGK